MIKAVIFDLDGTLLDTIEGIAGTGNQVLTRRGYSQLSIDQYKQFVGDGVKRLIERMMQYHHIPSPLFDELMDDYNSIYKELANQKTKPYQGILDLIKDLRKRGIKTGVLSNKPHHQVKDIMPIYFSDDDFEEVLGHIDGYPHKPDPLSLKDMIKGMNLIESEVLYVGDTSVDMKTALQAGVKSVGVLWGFRDEKELVNSQASYIVSHPSQILEIISLI